MRGRTKAVLASALLALVPAGCGWHAGLAPPSGARTIAVEFAANDTKLPELEVDLTDELHRAVLDRLDLTLAGRASADLVLVARLVDLRRRGGVRDEEARLLEGGVDLSVEVDLVEGSSGAVLRTTRRRLAAGFVVGPGLSPATAPQEPGARRRLLHNLADGVVLDLFAPDGVEANDEGGPRADRAPSRG